MTQSEDYTPPCRSSLFTPQVYENGTRDAARDLKCARYALGLKRAASAARRRSGPLRSWRDDGSHRYAEAEFFPVGRVNLNSSFLEDLSARPEAGGDVDCGRIRVNSSPP